MTGYLYLILSVLSSTVIVVVFKELKKYELDLLQVIAANYWVCTCLGAYFSPDFFSNLQSVEPSPLPLALIQGTFFIGIFYLMGTLTQRIGVGYVAILTKMSVVFPIMYSYLAFQEGIGWWRASGIVLALLSVWLINTNQAADQPEQKSSGLLTIMLAMLAFFGSGLIDSIFKYYHETHANNMMNENDIIIGIFGTAGIWGSILVGIKLAQRQTKLRWKNLIGGIALGLPNYFSIYFVVKSLEYFDGTVFFPVNNIGVVLSASLIGILLYREKYSRLNYLGILSAVAAILFIMFGEMAA